MKVLYLTTTIMLLITITKIIEYLTGQGGIMILGLIVISVFIFRKYKEKRYFKDVEKRMNNRDNKQVDK